MRKSIVLLNKDFLIYKEDKYSFDRIKEVNKLIKDNIKIVIAGKELSVRQIKDKVNKFRIDKYVNTIIDNDFPQNGDILYHYEMKDNVIFIYYIKGAKSVEGLIEMRKRIEVIPIQFIIKECIRKSLKENRFTGNVLIKFNEYYYYLSLKNGIYYSGAVNGDKKLILKKMLEDSDLKEIFIDISANDILPSNNKLITKKIDIGRFINESIFEKQKFYSRKVFS